MGKKSRLPVNHFMNRGVILKNTVAILKNTGVSHKNHIAIHNLMRRKRGVAQPGRPLYGVHDAGLLHARWKGDKRHVRRSICVLVGELKCLAYINYNN